MRSIFRGATKVLVWLGSEGEESSLALRTIDVVSRLVVERINEDEGLLKRMAEGWVRDSLMESKRRLEALWELGREQDGGEYGTSGKGKVKIMVRNKSEF